ncbi:MAG: APC family permease [Candidatus Odinarchaeia archaeon]
MKKEDLIDENNREKLDSVHVKQNSSISEIKHNSTETIIADLESGKLKKGYDAKKLLIFGLAFMAPALSLLATFNLVMTAGLTWMGIPLSYVIAGVAIIITSISFAELVKAYPRSGSVWSFARGAVGSRFGQFTVWIYLLEILIVPSAALIPSAFFMESWLGVPPYITVIVFVVVISLLAIGGTKLSVRSMATLFALQVGILIAFAVSAIIWSINTGNFTTQATISISPSGSLLGIAGIMVGATVAVYSFLGYEAPASVAGEAVNPKKTVARAIIGSAVIATALYAFLAWAFVLAIPSVGLHHILYYVNPVPAMGDVIWGAGLGNILNFAGIIAGLIAALAAVTASSRILQKLGEDKIAPKALSKVDIKLATPIVAIGVVSIITLIVGTFIPWEVVAYTIATGALPAFIITNLLAFWNYRKDGFTVKNIIFHGVIPWLGIALCAWFIIFGIPVHLKWILVIWVLIGVILVFANTIIRPKVFVKKLTDAEITAGSKEIIVSKLNVLALIVSIGVLILTVLGFTVWLAYYSAGVQWWHIIAPYASGDLTATITTVLMTVIFTVTIILVAFRTRIFKEKYKETANNEKM